MAAMADLPCWHCDAAESEENVRLLAVLRPRTAARGGPATLYRCLRCGVDNLVERNPAGEIRLAPPTVGNVSSPTVVRAVLAAARRWVALNADARAEFLARTEFPARTDTDGATHRAVATRQGTRPPPAPPPDVELGGAAEREPPLPRTAGEISEVAGLIDAYEVLGVALTATKGELSKRYRELARKCHPDRVADLDDEIRRVADRKFRRLTRAYEIIMDQFDEGSPSGSYSK